MRLHAVIVTQLFAFLLASTGLAAPVSVTNPGFEDISGETPVNEFTFGPLNGWALYDPENITDGGDGPNFYIGTLTPQEPDPIGNPGVYTFFPAGAPEGDRVGIAYNDFGTGNLGEYGLQQVLSSTLAPNTSYTLQVQIGNIASGTSVSNTFFNLDGFPGYRIDLMAGNEVDGFTILDSDNNSLGGSIAEGEFALSTVSFSTGGTHDQLGEFLAIRLVNLNVIDPSAPNANLEVDFDNVSLNAEPVPEPATTAALILGGILLWMVSDRRRRAPDLVPARIPSRRT